MKRLFILIFILSIITYNNDISDNEYLKTCNNNLANFIQFIHHIFSNFLLLAFIYIHIYPNKKFIKLYIYILIFVTVGWIIFNDRCWLDLVIYNICNKQGNIPRFRNIIDLYSNNRDIYKGDKYKIHKFSLLIIYLIYFNK